MDNNTGKTRMPFLQYLQTRSEGAKRMIVFGTAAIAGVILFVFWLFITMNRLSGINIAL